MSITKPLPNYLRMYRKRMGLTQSDLTYLLGRAHRSKISRYERGVRIPTLRTIIALEIVFGAPMEKLFAGIYGEVRNAIGPRATRLLKNAEARVESVVVAERRRALVGIVGRTSAKASQ